MIPLALLLAGNAGAQTCSWTVEKVRHPSPAEARLFVARTLAAETTSANLVCRGDSLCLHVRTDYALHPYIYLENSKTRRAELFVPYEATQPKWSPDGRYVALHVGRPPANTAEKGPYTFWLYVFDFVSRESVIEPVFSPMEAIWAPDSKSLLVSADWAAGGGVRLLNIRIPEGTTSVIDTTRQHGDYYFAWSPDQQWVLVSRPIGNVHSGDVITNEIWLISRSGDERCRIVDTPAEEQHTPLWMSDDKVVLDRVRYSSMSEDLLMAEDTLVVELKLEQGAPRDTTASPPDTTGHAK